MMWKCENVAAEFKVRSRRFSANQASTDFGHNNNGEKLHHVEEKLSSKWKKDAVATFK